MSCKFSVIIPLYNKETEIGRALRSVLAQTYATPEIIVVDDGSTDGSAAAVEKIIAEAAAGTPQIKLIRQSNAGETAARNRGMAEASDVGHAGNTSRTDGYFAFLDADDEWRPGFLAAIAEMISEFPGAGIYCTGFDIAKGGKTTPGRTPATRGIVADYFGESMSRFVATASSSVLPRTVVDQVGGFPEGMKLGGDQYMWTKVALARPVVFTPERLAVVHASGTNRSAAIYTPENTPYSFRDFYNAVSASDNSTLDEYIARVELGKAITATVKGGTGEGLKAERDFAYNRRSRRLWWRLSLLNRLPASWRPALNGLYNRLAWAFAKKGV